MSPYFVVYQLTGVGGDRPALAPRKGLFQPTRVGDCWNSGKTNHDGFDECDEVCFTMIKLLFLQMESGGFGGRL